MAGIRAASVKAADDQCGFAVLYPIDCNAYAKDITQCVLVLDELAHMAVTDARAHVLIHGQCEPCRRVVTPIYVSTVTYSGFVHRVPDVRNAVAKRIRTRQASAVHGIFDLWHINEKPVHIVRGAGNNSVSIRRGGFAALLCATMKERAIVQRYAADTRVETDGKRASASSFHSTSESAD
jgi:hypothetical protein